MEEKEFLEEIQDFLGVQVIRDEVDNFTHHYDFKYNSIVVSVPRGRRRTDPGLQVLKNGLAYSLSKSVSGPVARAREDVVKIKGSRGVILGYLTPAGIHLTFCESDAIWMHASDKTRFSPSQWIIMENIEHLVNLAESPAGARFNRRLQRQVEWMKDARAPAFSTDFASTLIDNILTHEEACRREAASSINTSRQYLVSGILALNRSIATREARVMELMAEVDSLSDIEGAIDKEISDSLMYAEGIGEVSWSESEMGILVHEFILKQSDRNDAPAARIGPLFVHRAICSELHQSECDPGPGAALSKRGNGVCHPHVNGSGDICYGNAGRGILAGLNQASRALSLASLVYTADFLRTAYTEDDSYSKILDWPEHYMKNKCEGCGQSFNNGEVCPDKCLSCGEHVYDVENDEAGDTHMLCRKHGCWDSGSVEVCPGCYEEVDAGYSERSE